MSDQIEMMDDDLKVIVRARRDDPEVSHEAAALLEAQEEKLQQSITVVLHILKKYEPCSDFQLREHWTEFWELGVPWSEHLPRMARLWAERRGKIVQAGETIHKGRRCRTWKIGEGKAHAIPVNLCPTCGRVIRKKKVKTI